LKVLDSLKRNEEHLLSLIDKEKYRFRDFFTSDIPTVRLYTYMGFVEKYVSLLGRPSTQNYFKYSSTTRKDVIFKDPHFPLNYAPASINW
jgi:hypothetical protein